MAKRRLDSDKQPKSHWMTAWPTQKKGQREVTMLFRYYFDYDLYSF
jgi:hypothetical protein